MKTAIRDDSPVVIFEDKMMYRVKGPVPADDYTIPFGVADIKRAGTDVTIVATSSMVQVALGAATMLEKIGISAEVIDPRTTAPLDKQALIDSVKKTSRAIVVDEGYERYGVTAELASVIAEGAFYHLDAPVKRIGAMDVPVPFSPVLEDLTVPSEKIASEEAASVAPAQPSAGVNVVPAPAAAVRASPLARKIAQEHGVDLAQVKPAGGKIEKADVFAHVARQKEATAGDGTAARLAAASPKARRLATERGVDIQALRGSGPGGAILAADVFAGTPSAATRAEAPGVGTVWRIMAERMTASWTTAPHFYLVREVTVSRLVSWRDRARKQTGARITYTDLLVKLVAAALAQHPGVNASWKDGAIVRNADINIGLAVA